MEMLLHSPCAWQLACLTVLHTHAAAPKGLKVCESGIWMALAPVSLSQLWPSEGTGMGQSVEVVSGCSGRGTSTRCLPIASAGI